MNVNNNLQLSTVSLQDTNHHVAKKGSSKGRLIQALGKPAQFFKKIFVKDAKRKPLSERTAKLVLQTDTPRVKKQNTVLNTKKQAPTSHAKKPVSTSSTPQQVATPKAKRQDALYEGLLSKIGEMRSETQLNGCYDRCNQAQRLGMVSKDVAKQVKKAVIERREELIKAKQANNSTKQTTASGARQDTMYKAMLSKIGEVKSDTVLRGHYDRCDQAQRLGMVSKGVAKQVKEAIIERRGELRKEKKASQAANSKIHHQTKTTDVHRSSAPSVTHTKAFNELAELSSRVKTLKGASDFRRTFMVLGSEGKISQAETNKLQGMLALQLHKMASDPETAKTMQESVVRKLVNENQTTTKSIMGVVTDSTLESRFKALKGRP